MFCECAAYTDYPCTQAGFDTLEDECNANNPCYAPIVECPADYDPIADIYDCVDAFEDCFPDSTP